LKHTAEGGSLAEEVISTIRTAQAFGTQSTLQGLYNKFVAGALAVDLEAARWQGGSFAAFFFIIYSAYALGQSFQPFF
jgi:ATP-binding cassette, subfamily B (MDR/TAP), member 1